MTIEYRFRFEQGELIVTQRVEPDAAGNLGANPTVSANTPVEKSVKLESTFDASVAARPNVIASAGGQNDPPGPGGRPGGTGRIVVFGPIVFCDSSTAGAGATGNPANKLDTKGS
jgi:hypothetical protein